METRANYVLIGSFVLLASLALVLFAVWISKVQFSQDFDAYDVVFEGPVNGLSEGGEVRFNGIKVGEVERLALDKNNPSNVIARIRVFAETPVRENSNAVLGMQGITGLTFIQIRSGDPSLPLLKDISAQDPPRIETERTQLEELFEGGQDLLSTSRDTLNRINKVFSQENVDRLSGILANIEAITGDTDSGTLVSSATDVMATVNTAGERIIVAADEITRAAAEFDQNVDLMTQETLSFLEDASEATQAANSAIAGLQSTIDNAAGDIVPETQDAIYEMNRLAQDLQLLVRRMDRVVATVEQDPRGFVLGDTKPYEE